jgi:hypothetical protein
MHKWISLLKTNKQLVASLLAIFIVGFFSIAQTLPEVCGRLAYELKEIANWDTGMYYAVGKGLVHGIPPYSGLYENKPPMIFFLSGVSYFITGGFYLVNIFSFLSFLIVALLPTAFVIYSGIAKKIHPVITIATAFAVLSISIFLASFAELRSGEVQIEIFGSAALFLAFFAMSLQKAAPKIYSPHIIACGIFLGMATMFKEPFFLLGLFSLFFFVHSVRDLFYHMVLPAAYAAVFSLLLLLITRSLVPYFTIYLANMFGSHLSIYGSPWDRAAQIFKIFDDLRNYSHSLEACVYILLTLNFLVYAKESLITDKCKVISFVKIPWIALCLYIASFCVGLGGQYYNHHHIFALPFYGILLFNIIKYINENRAEQQTRTFALVGALAICPLVALGFTGFKPFTVNENVLREIQEAKENAQYIDQVLDAVGEDRYLFIGFNGYHPYAYTKHDAIGPSFVQDHHNFSSTETFFSKAMAKQFDEANVVVFRGFNMDRITPSVIRTLNNCFTKHLPEKVQQISRPEAFRYDLHFRTEKDCSYLKK